MDFHIHPSPSIKPIKKYIKCSFVRKIDKSGGVYVLAGGITQLSGTCTSRATATITGLPAGNINMYIVKSGPQNIKFGPGGCANGTWNYCGTATPYTYNVTGNATIDLNIQSSGGAFVTC